MKTVEWCKLPLKRSISTRGIMYNMINIISTAVYYASNLLRVHSKSSYHKGSIFSFTLFLYDMISKFTKLTMVIIS